MSRPPSHASSVPEAPPDTGKLSAEGEGAAGIGWLPSLAQARAAQGRERGAALRRLQEELGALKAGPAPEARAQRLLELLKEEWLEALVDERGWTARALMTAALLNHGGATALLLHPDDLQHLREVRVRAHPGLRRGTLLGLLLSVLVVWGVLIATFEPPAPAYEPGPLFTPLQLLALLYVLGLPPVLLVESIRRHLSWRRQPNVRGVD